MPDVFEVSRRERLALADRLESFTEEQWATPSLCAGWDVRTVVGHVLTAIDPDQRPFVRAALRRGGRMNVVARDLAPRNAAHPTAELVRLLRERAGSRQHPPVIGPRGPLADLLVHAGDIALPLGLDHDPDPAHVGIALEFLRTGHPWWFFPRGRLRGLRLVATDLGAGVGDGLELRGRAVDLLMGACGRRPAVDALDGAGVTVLRARIG